MKNKEKYENKKVYDFTKSKWGHAIHLWKEQDEEGKVVRMTAHGSGVAPILNSKEKTTPKLFIGTPTYRIKEGDLIRVSMNDGGYLIDWEVDEIKYERDPKDMFTATISFFNVAEKDPELPDLMFE